MSVTFITGHAYVQYTEQKILTQDFIVNSLLPCSYVVTVTSYIVKNMYVVQVQ